MPTKKSGLTKYGAGEAVFSIKDKANSLFIIQKGQIRLFVPKGKGFVDLAILRPGEVIGEMAYFYGDSAKIRSCSAVAVNEVELIEIPFEKFEKTIESLNPWFKVIVNTLADRIRNSNEKIKELESNSITYGKKKGDYTFFQNIDIVRGLAHFYMIFKAQATEVENSFKMEKEALKNCIVDIYGFKESKLEEFIYLLESENLIEIEENESGRKSIISIGDIELFKKLYSFINSQRLTEDEKKLNISFKCEEFLGRIFKSISPDEAEMVSVQLNPILEEFKTEKINVGVQDLEGAIKNKFIEDPINGPDNQGLICSVKIERLRYFWPCISLVNAIARFNNARKKKESY